MGCNLCKLGTNVESPSESPIESGIPHTKLKDDDDFEVPGHGDTSPIELNDDDGFKEIPTKADETLGSDKEQFTKKAVLVHSTDCDWCAVCVIISFIFWAAVVALSVALIGDALNSTPAPTPSPSVAPTAGCNTTCFEICDSYCTVAVIEEEGFYSDFCRDMCDWHGDSADDCEYTCYVRLALDCKVDCEIECNC